MLSIEAVAVIVGLTWMLVGVFGLLIVRWEETGGTECGCWNCRRSDDRKDRRSASERGVCS
jgi:hypothetical protein